MTRHRSTLAHRHIRTISKQTLTRTHTHKTHIQTLSHVLSHNHTRTHKHVHVHRRNLADQNIKGFIVQKSQQAGYCDCRVDGLPEQAQFLHGRAQGASRDTAPPIESPNGRGRTRAEITHQTLRPCFYPVTHFPLQRNAPVWGSSKGLMVLIRSCAGCDSGKWHFLQNKTNNDRGSNKMIRAL